MLNAPVRTMTKDEITNYIRTFDQRSNLLWGIFDKRTGSQIGFFTVNADYDQTEPHFYLTKVHAYPRYSVDGYPAPGAC